LLVIVTVAVGAGVYFWTTTYMTGLQKGAEERVSIVSGKINETDAVVWVQNVAEGTTVKFMDIMWINGTAYSATGDVKADVDFGEIAEIRAAAPTGKWFGGTDIEIIIRTERGTEFTYKVPDENITPGEDIW
jgi:hypothetical protein